MRVALVLAGIGNGVVWSIQARAAAEMSTAIGDSLLTVLITFAGGSVLIAVAAIPSFVRRRWRLESLRRIPIGLLTGGLFGAAIVWTQTAVVPVLGMALATSAFVLGNILTGTVSDVTGFGAAGRLTVSAPRLIAIAALIAAVGLAASRSDGIDVGAMTVLLILIALCGGAATNLSQTVNGRFRTLIGDPLLPTLMNFALAAAVVAVLWLLSPGRVDLAELGAAPAWAFVTPPFAALVVFVSAILAPKLGALALAAAIVAGQFLGALALDLIVPVPDRPVEGSTVVAVAIALIAAVLVGLPPRRRRDPPTPEGDAP